MQNEPKLGTSLRGQTKPRFNKTITINSQSNNTPNYQTNRRETDNIKHHQSKYPKTSFNSKAFPQYCTAVGISSGAVGKDQSFKIILRSQGGGLLVGGISSVEVNIDGPETIEADITNMKDGNYNVTYLPKKRGLYDIEVSLFPY